MKKVTLIELKKEIRILADPKRAKFLSRFFKTGKGEYGYGDIFLGGINTPTINKMVSKYKTLDLKNLEVLIASKYHEERMLALGILKKHFERAKKSEKKEIYNFYLRNTKHINNWDLVDVTADKIIGVYMLENPVELLKLNKLIKSKSIWERRIAVITTFAFIKEGKFNKTFELVKELLDDKEDLLHKASGWMLREIGKRDIAKEKKFLNKYYKFMPRTMLRYAIEKFPENLRLKYLHGEV